MDYFMTACLMSPERKNNYLEFTYTTYRAATQQNVYLCYQSKKILHRSIHSQVSVRIPAILHPKMHQNIP